MLIKLNYTVTFSLTTDTDNAGYTQPDNIDSIVRQENFWINDGHVMIDELMQNTDNLLVNISGEIIDSESSV